MNLAEHKLDLFRQIDGLSEDVLLELEAVIAKLKEKKINKPKRSVGCMKGIVTYISDDFESYMK